MGKLCGATLIKQTEKPGQAPGFFLSRSFVIGVLDIPFHLASITQKRVRFLLFPPCALRGSAGNPLNDPKAGEEHHHQSRHYDRCYTSSAHHTILLELRLRCEAGAERNLSQQTRGFFYCALVLKLLLADYSSS
jgi:hypothetical protein